MRYQPPLQTKDQNGQFAELARVLDAREPPAAYAVARGTSVQVGAGETRRLAPRAAGMTAIIPAADETNYGALITLLVDSALGATRIAPVSGTINGAAAFTISAGYKSLLVLMSDGEGRWLTERAEGFPLTNGDKGDITVSGNGDNWQIDALAVGTAELAASAVTTAKIADANVTPVKLAQGVVAVTGAGPHNDVALSADTVGVRVENTSTITGFTGGFEGRVLLLCSLGVTPTLAHATGSDAGNQIACPTGANISLGVRGGAVLLYSNTFWRVAGSVNS